VCFLHNLTFGLFAAGFCDVKRFVFAIKFPWMLIRFCAVHSIAFRFHVILMHPILSFLSRAPYHHFCKCSHSLMRFHAIFLYLPHRPSCSLRSPRAQVMVGYRSSLQDHVFESAHRLPKFAAFEMLRATDASAAKRPASAATFAFTERTARIRQWVDQVSVCLCVPMCVSVCASVPVFV
jgi:hypothetical protein